MDDKIASFFCAQQVDVKNGEQGGDGGQSINPISRLIQIQQVSVAIITCSAIEM